MLVMSIGITPQVGRDPGSVSMRQTSQTVQYVPVIGSIARVRNPQFVQMSPWVAMAGAKPDWKSIFSDGDGCRSKVQTSKV